MVTKDVNNYISVYSGTDKVKLKDGGKLADIAPTVLEILCVPVPQEMTAVSLIQK